MDAAVRAEVLRHVRGRRFDRLAVLLGDAYAAETSDDIGRALDSARRCERLTADAQTLRRSAADIEGEIDGETRGILAGLGLQAPAEESMVRRWWDRVRGRASPRSERAPHSSTSASDSPNHSLAAYGLGWFEVLIEGAPVVEWTSRRGEAVLKLLLIRGGGPVHREELMASLWPDTPYARARNRLNVAIHGLRQSLGAMSNEQFVVFDAGSYRVGPRIDRWFDVDEFDERLRRGRRHRHAGHAEAAMSEFRCAVALYSGDLFADDTTCEWAEEARRRLRTRYTEMLNDLGEQALRIGDLRACLDWSERLLEVEPWHEDAHARIMRVHARRGQSFLALRQFVVCARSLRSELEATPTRPLLDLYEQIRRGNSV